MPDSWDFSRPKQRQADPLAQMPLLTYVLVALCVVITGASMVTGGQTGSVLATIGNFGYADVEQIWDGHLWGLVTTVFIHGGVIHLFFNMLWLVMLGRVLERSLPPAIYLLFLAAAAAAGSACEILISGQTGIGMSGVVYAMFGLLWGGRGSDESWRAVATRDNLRWLVGWGLFCVVATQFHFAGFSIANGAHGGGFLFGLCIGYLFYSPRRRYVWAAPFVLLLAGCVLACVWLPWSGEWSFWKGNHEFERKHYAQAIRWYQSSLKHGGDRHYNWHNISLAWNNIAVDASAHKNLPGFANAMSQSQSAAEQAGPEQ